LMWIGTDFVLVRGRAIEAIATADALWDPVEYTNVARDGIAESEEVVHLGVTVYCGTEVRKAVAHEVGVSHLVRFYIDGRLEDVRFRVYRPHIPEDILTERLVGSYVVSDGKKTGIGFNVGNFALQWSVGEEVVLEVVGVEGTIEYRTKVSFELDGGVDIQDLGTVTLQVSDGEGAMGSIGGSIPCSFSLGTYPNPARHDVFIQYALPKNSHVTIEVFDIAGRRVKKLVDALSAAGYYVLPWRETQRKQLSLRSGIYYVRIRSGDYKETKKIIFFR